MDRDPKHKTFSNRLQVSCIESAMMRYKSGSVRRLIKGNEKKVKYSTKLIDQRQCFSLRYRNCELKYIVINFTQCTCSVIIFPNRKTSLTLK